MNRRAREKDAKRARIYSAAKRLFSQRGFAGTTIAQIARQANVGTGTVFLYARDKGALLAQVFCREVQKVQHEALAELDSALPFHEQLLALFSAFFDYYAEDQALARIFLKELLFTSKDSPELAQATQSFVGAIAGLVQDAVRRGEVRDDLDPLQIAAIMFGVYWTCVMAWLGGALPSQELALQQLGRALGVVMSGVASRPSPRRARKTRKRKRE
jgi:AcrR family transcriptional regulator